MSELARNIGTTQPLMTELAGKYRILAQLGEGGTATVSLAVARGPSGFSKLVVLKVMKSNLLTEVDFAEMFLNEARLSARLNHPNIVQTNEVFEHMGAPIIVMEYLEGQALSKVLSRARAQKLLPLAMHLRILCEVLSGLHHAHELKDFDGTSVNVVHRDVSPQNVFITFDGQVKLLDFGIAKLSGSSVETATGIIKGKIRYMPPEQVAGGKVDRRADVFAVGVMLWEAATGCRMWQGLHDASIIGKLIQGKIPAPSEVAAGVDPRLEEIVIKALMPNPEHRYETAADLQLELEDYLAQLKTTTRMRDIGKLVSDMFEDVRTQRRAIIEEQLSKVTSLTDAEYFETAPVELTQMSGTASSQLSNLLTATMTGTTQRDGMPNFRKRFPLGAFLAVILVAGIGALSWKLLAAPGQRVETISAAAAAAATHTSEVPPAPERVKLSITAYPQTATIRWDGEAVASNPFSKEGVKGTGPHKLVVEAPGHRAEEREVTFDSDSQLVIVLQTLPAAATKPTTKSRSTVTVSRPRVTAPAPVRKTNCDPPYYITSEGLKRFKPECL